MQRDDQISLDSIFLNSAENVLSNQTVPMISNSSSNPANLPRNQRPAEPAPISEPNLNTNRGIIGKPEDPDQENKHPGFGWSVKRRQMKDEDVQPKPKLTRLGKQQIRARMIV
jgi:hypothetical protein